MRLLIATSMILMSAGAHAENDKSLTGHGLTTITGTATTIKSRSYVFEPKDDITAPELAKAMKIVLPFIAKPKPFHARADRTDRQRAGGGEAALP
jgi:hypothetical protein